MEKIQRQKIEERQQLTYSDKQGHIAKKSDERCCHCGRKVYFDFGATVEHFIPLSKGGTNRDINLYMLCEDCNKEKGNAIYRPTDYMEFLGKEYLNQLNDYFESYIKSFEFVNKNNILAFDRYKVHLIHATVNKTKRVKKKALKNISTAFWVKKATKDDLDNITDFMAKICDKKLDGCDREALYNLIVFFYIHGCIYYQETPSGIRTVSFITTRNHSQRKRVKKFLRVDNFALYNNQQTLSMLWNFAEDIPYHIIEEQGLDQIPQESNFTLNSIPDKHEIFWGKEEIDAKPVDPDDDEKTQKFFEKFDTTDLAKFVNWNKKDIDLKLLPLFFDSWEINEEGMNEAKFFKMIDNALKQIET